MNAPVKSAPTAIEPTAVYTAAEAAALLRVHRNTLAKLSVRQLRYASRPQYLGQDLLDFLRPGPAVGP